MRNKEAVIIFIKNPVVGKVKTRIAKDTNDQKAYEIYLALLQILYQKVQVLKHDVILFYSDFIDINDQWDNQRFGKQLQSGEDIGQRMSNAFNLMFNHYDRIILIGSDCPSIDEEVLISAFDQLEKNDVVIGPALDGGYYLIGMKKPNPSIFHAISWSTEKVFHQSVKRILDLNLQLATIKPLSDIDTIQEWEKYLSTADTTNQQVL